MKPLQFEALYRAEWDELRALLAALHGPRAQRQAAAGAGPRIATLYRRSCEHLALAVSRGYPAHIVEPLQQLTAEAHQLIYQQRSDDSAYNSKNAQNLQSLAEAGIFTAAPRIFDNNVSGRSPRELTWAGFLRRSSSSARAS